MMRSLACCRRRARDISIDFDEHDDRVVTYNGPESRIIDCCSYEDDDSGASGSGTSGTDGCVVTDSLDEDATSSSSSKDAFVESSAFSSDHLVSGKHEEKQPLYKSDSLRCINYHLSAKEKAPLACAVDASDVESMKERFAKLLLGDDVSGGASGISASLALSNAISNLSASVFGELWKLEPLAENKKSRWRREMGWLLSPANYIVELVPAKQNDSNGRCLEIMTPKARSDVHVNLPALQKLDAMLIDLLESMVQTEFSYAEGGSRAEGRSRISNVVGARPCQKWWLPSPRVPESGLSFAQRRRLCFQAKFVNQILKAAKSINEQVLLQMPVPANIRDALPKPCRLSLGDRIYDVVTSGSDTAEKMLFSLNLRSEHGVLEAVNRLEGAILAWKQRISDEASKRSLIRHPWHFVRDAAGGSQTVKIESASRRAETILRLLKTRFPNLPRTFIDVSKVQCNKDVGHSIVEAYSRVLASVAFSVLMRISDVLQEDDMKKPTTPMANHKFDLSSDVCLAGIVDTPPGRFKRSLVDQMDLVDGRSRDGGASGEQKKRADEEHFQLVGESTKAMVAVTAGPCGS